MKFRNLADNKNYREVHEFLWNFNLNPMKKSTKYTNGVGRGSVNVLSIVPSFNALYKLQHHKLNIGLGIDVLFSSYEFKELWISNVNEFNAEGEYRQYEHLYYDKPVKDQSVNAGMGLDISYKYLINSHFSIGVSADCFYYGEGMFDEYARYSGVFFSLGYTF